MSAQEFMTFAGWDEMNPLQQSVVKGLLRSRIMAKLPKGTHAFDSVYELLARVGVDHLTTGQIEMKAAPMKNFSISEDGVFFRMSVRRFLSFVRDMNDIRFRSFSLASVEREGAPRTQVVVS